MRALLVLLITGLISLSSSNHCGRRAVGYFTSWGSRDFTDEQASRLTHVIFAFFHTSPNGTVSLKDGQARARLTQLKQVAARHSHLKLLYAIGGWENSEYFSLLAADEMRREVLIRSIAAALEEYGMDGVDIDWEYPVTGGSQEGDPVDRNNYVDLLRELRLKLDELQREKGRRERYLISFAGAAGQWVLKPGFDLINLMRHADFVNVMSYDYFGAWKSKWGAFTGPPAPLHFASPKGSSGKMNVHATIKYYACQLKSSDKINMGIPFYGRFWKRVSEKPMDGGDEMWRKAEPLEDKENEFKGGHVEWRYLESTFPTAQFRKFHTVAKTPYLWLAENRTFVGYEDPESIGHKMEYGLSNELGGVMIWAIDQDDDSDTLLRSVVDAPFCSVPRNRSLQYKCAPITNQRWWTFDDGEHVAGMCGRSAPLYQGYYPVCDPDDPAHSCCGPFGYCGSGPAYCDCPTCVDYGNHPELILQEPVKPTKLVTWYTLDAPDGKRGRCGSLAPSIGDKTPTCNGDDPTAKCCSNGGYCGATKEHCECTGCIDFSKKKEFVFKKVEWWTYGNGPENIGKCGPLAPLLPEGISPKCDPESAGPCCSRAGYCGVGEAYCSCAGCVDYRTKQ
ncbi:cht-2 [Pristionchus pacificus]|uniref:GH18 domain-containing protein n=1 Tax=Pristionchus pacificus TaxID=54126 RepID=A0A8R1YH56_PRIPA|nr:cht-2 [Pristionchus pacificus]